VLHFTSPLKSASLNGVLLHGAQQYGTVIERGSRRNMLTGEVRPAATKPAITFDFLFRTHLPDQLTPTLF
jgi:hypothetical protein